MNQMEQLQVDEVNNMPVVKTWQGQRVVTFKDIDEVHGRPSGTARRNYNKNKKHFIEGEDYFRICADEIRTHKIAEISPKAHEDMLLFTETGYLMLVKSFRDDLSWEVQRKLVNTYFKARELVGQAQKQAKGTEKESAEKVRLLPEFKGGNIEDKQLAAEFIQDYIVEKQDDAGVYHAYMMWCLSNNRTFLPEGFFQRVKKKVVDLRLKTGEWKPYNNRIKIQGGSL